MARQTELGGEPPFPRGFACNLPLTGVPSPRRVFLAHVCRLPARCSPQDAVLTVPGRNPCLRSGSRNPAAPPWLSSHRHGTAVTSHGMKHLEGPLPGRLQLLVSHGKRLDSSCSTLTDGTSLLWPALCLSCAFLLMDTFEPSGP